MAALNLARPLQGARHVKYAACFAGEYNACRTVCVCVLA